MHWNMSFSKRHQLWSIPKLSTEQAGLDYEITDVPPGEINADQLVRISAGWGHQCNQFVIDLVWVMVFQSELFHL